LHLHVRLSDPQGKWKEIEYDTLRLKLRPVPVEIATRPNSNCDGRIGIVAIGSPKLLDALQPGSLNDENEGFASKEAENIYNEILASPKSLSLGNSSELDCSRLPAIFFFTDDATLGLPDSELIEELKIDNPEWFD